MLVLSGGHAIMAKYISSKWSNAGLPGWPATDSGT